MRNRKHDIERYVRGELTPSEMHALEKEALNDPFLAEALEGVEQAGKDNFLFDLHKLNRSVHNRTRKRKSRSLTMWGWPTGIAATLLLIAVSGYLVVSLLRDQEVRQHAMQKESPPAEDTRKSPDSLNVGSGPVAQTEEPKEETSAHKERSSPSVKPSGPADVKDKVAAEEKPVDQDIALEKQLLAEQKAEEEQAEELEAAREQLAIADVVETPVRDEHASELKKKTDGSQLAGATERRAKAAEVPSRVPSVSSTLLPDSILIKGKVLSAEDGHALPGVNVIMKGTTKGTVTDASGNYQLSVPAQNTSLLFSFIGFETEEVPVADQPEVNVELTEDVASLSEVVIVSGYGSANDATAPETFHAAEPQTGRSDFKDYLENSVKYPEEAIKNKTEGKVTVRFTVEPSGQLTGFEILKGIGSGCDEELIRAIKEGPAWRSAKQAGRAVSDKVKVRYRFELPL